MRTILPWVSVNGTIIPQGKAVIAIGDDGFLYAYGFFTTLKVREGVPLFWEKHRKRLQISSQHLGFSHIQPDCFTIARHDAREIIKKNALVDGAVRITVTRGLSAMPTVVIHATTIDTQVHSVSVVTVPDERDTYKTIKMTYRVPHILAMQKAREHGAQDALFTHDSFLIESTYANIYSYTPEGNIITPPIAGRGLEGISRQVLLAALPIEEQEIFSTTKNPIVLVSSLGMRVVERIDGRVVRQDTGFIATLEKALDDAEKNYLVAYRKNS